MRLAAIVFTDIVGFSKLTEGDEVTGLELLATLKRMANKPPIDPRVQMNMGSIYLQLGQVDKCIELLESIKDKLLGMEIGELKTDATWDPVRDHEIFKAIVQ